MKSRAKNSGLLRRLALGGVVATLPLINSGCANLRNDVYRGTFYNETQEEKEQRQRGNRLNVLSFLSFAGVHKSRTVQQAASLNAAGHALQTEAARSGYARSGPIAIEIGCYVSGQDTNGNGYLDHREMNGLGSLFSANEPIKLYVSLSQPLGEFGLWLCDSSGETINQKTVNNSDGVEISYNNGSFSRKLGPGNYQVIVGLRGEQIGKKKFSVR